MSGGNTGIGTGIAAPLPAELAATGSAAGNDPGTTALSPLPALGLPQESYVTIPETSSPHGSLSTAQVLPDLDYFGVVGSLGSGEGIDLFRLTLQNAQEGLDFGLVALRGNEPVPMQFQLFDGSGHVLGSWTLGGPNNLSISLAPANLPAGTTLFLGISSSGAGGAASTAVDYQLWVAHESPATPLSISVPGAFASTVLPVLSTSVTPLSAPGLSVAQTDSPADSTAPSSPQVPLSLASGALVIRQALPSGGLLFTADPAAQSPRQTTELDSRDSITGPLATTGTERPGEVQPAAPAPSGEPETLVAVRGPGGFPLLGVSAVGSWRRREAEPDDGSDSTPTIGDWNSTETRNLESPGLDLSSVSLASEQDALTQESESGVRAWRGLPVSISSSLGLATVLTLNALLSQPIAGFDYLASRLYRSGIGSFSRQKRRSGNVAPGSTNPFAP
jgi:hypothetical protein